jgi:predicted ATPase with chaperone activity
MPAVVMKSQKRILGSMLDRIDIHIEVPRRA